MTTSLRYAPSGTHAVPPPACSWVSVVKSVSWAALSLGSFIVFKVDMLVLSHVGEKSILKDLGAFT
eukprot:15338555-Ditylum_brightwellii.AAC.1